MIGTRISSSIVPLSNLRTVRPVINAVIVIASFGFITGQMLGLIALPFYIQPRLGMTATEAGFCMVPWPAAVAVAAPISGRLADRMKTAWLCCGRRPAGHWPGGRLVPADPRGVTFEIGTVSAGPGFGLF